MKNDKHIICTYVFCSIFSTNIQIVQWCHLCQCYQCPLPQKRLYPMYSIQMKITYPRQQSPSSSSRQLPKSIPGGGLSTTWVSVDIPNHQKKSAIEMKYSNQKSNTNDFHHLGYWFLLPVFCPPAQFPPWVFVLGDCFDWLMQRVLDYIWTILSKVNTKP